MSLYQLDEQWMALQAALTNADETPEEQAQHEQMLEDLQRLAAHEMDSIARLIRNIEGEILAEETEIKRLKASADRKKAAVARLTRCVQNSMVLTGITRAETSIGRWLLRTNPPHVEIIDSNAVPGEYLVLQDPKVNKAAILAAFKETGEIIPGTDIRREQAVRFE